MSSSRSSVVSRWSDFMKRRFLTQSSSFGQYVGRNIIICVFFSDQICYSLLVIALFLVHFSCFAYHDFDHYVLLCHFLSFFLLCFQLLNFSSIFTKIMYKARVEDFADERKLTLVADGEGRRRHYVVSEYVLQSAQTCERRGALAWRASSSSNLSTANWASKSSYVRDESWWKRARGVHCQEWYGRGSVGKCWETTSTWWPSTSCWWSCCTVAPVRTPAGRGREPHQGHARAWRAIRFLLFHPVR